MEGGEVITSTKTPGHDTYKDHPGRVRIRPEPESLAYASKHDLLEISEELVEMIHLGHPIQTLDLQGLTLELVLSILAMHFIDTFDHEAD